MKHACARFWLDNEYLQEHVADDFGSLCGQEDGGGLTWLEPHGWEFGPPDCDVCMLLVLSKLKELEESD